MNISKFKSKKMNINVHFRCTPNRSGLNIANKSTVLGSTLSSRLNSERNKRSIIYICSLQPSAWLMTISPRGGDHCRLWRHWTLQLSVHRSEPLQHFHQCAKAKVFDTIKSYRSFLFMWYYHQPVSLKNNCDFYRSTLYANASSLLFEVKYSIFLWWASNVSR